MKHVETEIEFGRSIYVGGVYQGPDKDYRAAEITDKVGPRWLPMWRFGVWQRQGQDRSTGDDMVTEADPIREEELVDDDSN